ncbi:MAG TPA: SsrA-binding protein SmpB [Spirochaetia bacterium]|nr:SsrA-binding protein SmpB [Spirochaetia bacterium]
MAKSEGIKILAVNKKARFNYSIDESFECGVVLVGTEVKSMKEGRFSFADAYASVENDELWLRDLHVTPYAFGNRINHEPLRKRKLLVHRKEIKRLKRITDEKGLTLVPLKFYLSRGYVKCELGIARGKKLFDKRDDIRKRDQKRELEREFRVK